MIKPLSPSEAMKRKAESIPDYVLEGFNNIIAQKINNSKWARVTQNEAIEAILELAPEGVTRQTLFNNNWLDVEKIYRAAGWKVDYDKPAYNDGYEAFFIFQGAK